MVVAADDDAEPEDQETDLLWRANKEIITVRTIQDLSML